MMSIFEFESGRFVLPFFAIAGIVFTLGAFVQIFSSRGYYEKIEESEMPEIQIGARLLYIRRTAFLNAFFVKYMAEFIDVEDNKRIFSISKQIANDISVGADGQLFYKGGKFVDFIPGE